MLTHPTTERLHELGLIGMACALEEQRRQPDSYDLGFKDRLAMLVDREEALERERELKRQVAWLRFAGLREPATPEDVNYRATRALDRALFQRLTSGEWIERHQNLLVTGKTGTGKTSEYPAGFRRNTQTKSDMTGGVCEMMRGFPFQHRADASLIGKHASVRTHDHPTSGA